MNQGLDQVEVEKKEEDEKPNPAAPLAWEPSWKTQPSKTHLTFSSKQQVKGMGSG